MPASCEEISERLKDGSAMYDAPEQWGRRLNGDHLENYVLHAPAVFDQTLSNLNVADSVFVPDYNDSTKDYTNSAGALVGVISGRFVSTGTRRLSTSISPQRPTPLPPYDFNERVRWNELIAQSLLDAGNALLKDSNCRRALGLSKSGVYSLTRALLKNTDTGMLAFGTVAITVGRGKSAAVYFGSSFFNDTMYKLYDYGPRNARQWRALTVLHEIAHAQNKIPDDAGDAGQNTANDKHVLAECMKGISSVPTQDPSNIPPPR